ncbi:MAG TPA: condensation domain-containing protein, partial [Thermoanaerobaculia bacterium]
ALRLTGDLDVPVLAATLAELTRRHETLRTTFRVGAGGRPVQVIAPPEPLAIPFVDLSRLPSTVREPEVRRLVDSESARPFDLATGPLLRVLLVLVEPGASGAEREHALVLNVHHIASDGWSNSILIREVTALYEAFRLPSKQGAGRPSPLAPLPLRYADFAAWQREVLSGESLAEKIAYWREHLAAVPVLSLPTDRPRQPILGPAGHEVQIDLPLPVTEAVKALGRQHGATLFMILNAAFQALLYRYTGQSDFAVGTPIAGRDRVEVEGLIGFFINTLALRADLTGDPPFAELLGRARRTALDGFAHQELPFEKLIEELNPERSFAHTPLFQVMCVLQNVPVSALTAPGLRIEPMAAASGTAKYDMTMTLGEHMWGMGGSVEYRTELFDETTVLRLLTHFERLLEGIVAAPDTRLSELALLPAAERQQLIALGGDGRQSRTDRALAHAALEARALSAPAALAVEHGERRLTYGELDAQAERLAQRLQALGVRPETVVGVGLPRSLDLVVALLAVLKAGGVYLPLDPAYPPR